MAEPDLSSLNEQERATFWTGAIVRNTMLLEVTLRSILRSLSRKHPADPVEGEPVDFESLLLAVIAGIEAKFEPERGREIGEALEECGSVHGSAIGVLDSLWGVLEGSDVFQMLDLLPADPESRTPAVPVTERDFQELRAAQVRAYLRLGGVEKVVRHASYDAPFDTEADGIQRWAQVRGEFEVGSDGAMLFRDASVTVKDVAVES